MPSAPPDPWKNRWNAIAPSEFAWEAEALQRLKEVFGGWAYEAWSNFQFVTPEGNIYEVDLLLLTRAGLVMVEIKSWPGILRGDTHTWLLTREDGSQRHMDNPILLADRKTKYLKRMIENQPAFRGNRSLKLPYVQPAVYLSSMNLQCQLNPTARANIYTYADTRTSEGKVPKIVGALNTQRGQPLGTMGPPLTPALEKAMVESLQRIGVRRPNRAVRIGDYRLGRLLDEGPGWQDRVASHTSVKLERRVRQYLYSQQKSDEERTRLRRAARREFEVSESILHPNILRALEFREHENGPALIFEYDETAVRLDQFMPGAKLDLDRRLQLVRQIAEALAYAHSRKVVHRALGPRCVLVHDAATDRPTVTIMNWQAAARSEGTTAGVTGTIHVRELVDDEAQVYMAPEAMSDASQIAAYSDIFSLGAVAHLIITGQPPAADRLALGERLRAQKGLRVSAVSDGILSELDDLVQMSTNPNIAERVSSVVEFLEMLSSVDQLLATPGDVEVNPLDAKPGDLLPGGFVLEQRLGRGAVSLALLVKREEQSYVLKIAHSPSDNATLEQEARVLEQLHDRHVVRLHQVLDMGGQTALLLAPAGDDTLADRLQKDGPFALDLLERLGTDLLDAVAYLEERGIHHRDIKPANIGVALISKKRLELVLFDFSLSRAPLDQIRAGTSGYLDPFLSLRRPPRWDLHAERYAAAATLYEMATGLLPRWGDGVSDPALVECELVLEAERFDAGLREPLTAFFRRAFDRDPTLRFDNAEEMRTAWQEVFATAFKPAEQPSTMALDDVGLDTPVSLLPLAPSHLQALDRLNVLTVRDLLEVQSAQLITMRGIGNEARRVLADAVTQLRKRFPQVEVVADTTAESVYIGLDPIVRRILDESLAEGLARLRDGLWDAARGDGAWPSSADLAERAGEPLTEVASRLPELARKWHRDASVKALSNTVAELVEANGGVAEVEELAAAVLAARGSVQADRALRVAQARLTTRVAVDAEASDEVPRYSLRRTGTVALVAQTPALSTYADELGRQADILAQADPLVSPQRALQMLREVPLPSGMEEALSDHRLLKLATACSAGAALSSRQEIYPRGMAAVRALVLAHGSLLGATALKLDEVQERVRSRYPRAQALPGRPSLDALLEEAQWDFCWSPEESAYVRKSLAGGPSSSSTWIRHSTTEGTRAPVTEDNAAARMLDERLQRAERGGAFIVLAVSPGRLRKAEVELQRRFDVQAMWLDEALIQEMHRLADLYEAKWSTVIETDADLRHPDRRNLLELAREAMDGVEARIRASKRTVVLSRAGLLARYGMMDRVEALRDSVGRRDGIVGLWLLVPCPESQPLPTLDGQAIPLLMATQHARIPEAWLHNEHRGSAEALAQGR